MITIYSDEHRYQNATAELIDGKFLPPFEMPKRAEMVLEQVRLANLGEVLPPEEFGLEPILQVHDQQFVSFLSTAWSEWVAAHGDYDALPLNWATRTMRQDRIPEAIDGKLSYYSFDAGTPITAGTWRAIRASANVALTGQKRVANGEQAVFALCRPPGHHAGRDLYGGYCFLNNAAIAAQAFRDAGAERVAVLDIDYHHGNGTQSIFYDRADIFFLSLHAHPKDEYPYFLGYEDEIGVGQGEGFNRNYPMPWGTDWGAYQKALADAVNHIGNYAPDVVVISLGVDTFEHDPISKFRLKQDDYQRIGEAIAHLGKPTLFVMEGGYAVAEIGINAVNVLSGFEAA
ncbi:histone deacetylase family protein [Cyanobacteria bacterium FACHB-471]|nr:histone deacetylase family protein [Cyanobacteria bacterium FACHB-471]